MHRAYRPFLITTGARSGTYRGAARAIVVALGLLSVATPLLRSQETLVMDHTKGVWLLKMDTVRTGDKLRVGSSMRVRIDNTNSAFFTCKVTAEEVKVPEVDAGTAFLAGLKGYLPELALSMDPMSRPQSLVGKTFTEGVARAHDPARVDTAALIDAIRRDARKALEDSLKAYATVLTGTDGLREAHAQVTLALDSLRRTMPVDTERVRKFRDSARRFCSSPADTTCARLKATALLAATYPGLRHAVDEFRNALGLPGGRAVMNADRDLLRAGDEALAAADETMGFAYVTEFLVFKTFNAKQTLTCADTVPVKWNKGYKTTVVVAPSAVPQLQRIAPRAQQQLVVEALPNWVVQPKVGLMFLRAPEAKYPVYSAKQRPDTTLFDIVALDSTDRRFNYALTLSVAVRPALGGKDMRRTHWALHLPELLAGTGDVKQVGYGAGVSWRFLKVGAGLVWTKHTTLAGQHLGQVLRSAAELSQKDGWGKGKRYVSFSIVGVPPFLP
jgi:hypothetical protein